ncbi:DUF2254 family protein [Qipengyuania sp.]|uniref:DUF2254 family protein n=1 Tax=Qipengyuania sp. TaxID=2004515 RepID=UPI0035C79C8D
MANVSGGGVKGRRNWAWHRLVANYWSLPMLAVLAAIPCAVAALAIDRDFFTQFLLGNDLSPVATSDTAKDLVGVAVGINAAFLTLYFSISLLVLTVASSNLGVRLVDRWLDKRLVRVSLSGLCFTLVFSLAILGAIDAEAPLSRTPLGSIGAVIGFQAINVLMLSVALHDLGRTIFVDRSIHYLGKEAAKPENELSSGTEFAGEWGQTITAPREGYVEGADLPRLARMLRQHEGAIRVCCAPGQHVLAGEPMLRLQYPYADCEKLSDSVAIGDFRSDAQGVVFRVRLLVEIAARALSPAVNDFYTAIACADRLAKAMEGQADRWVDDGLVAVWARDRRFELPGQDFEGLFRDPLAALRQAACDYPSVTLRLLDNIRKLVERGRKAGQPAGLTAFLIGQARAFAEHAADRASFQGDRDDIMAGLSKVESAGS